MGNCDKRFEVRGAGDLATLWRDLPVAVLRYPVTQMPDVLVLSDILRSCAWRERCAAQTLASCAESNHNCQQAGNGCCRADCLFPVQLGGGAHKWRMATLFLQYWPDHQELFLVAMGAPACEEIGWAARCLQKKANLAVPQPLPVSRFDDLILRNFTRWRLHFVTPWVVGKNIPHDAVHYTPDSETVSRELRKSLRARAYKFTALCTHETTWQRLGGHLVHHVADLLLSDAIKVEHIQIEVVRETLQKSVANGKHYKQLTWQGEVTLDVNKTVLPWLSLIAVCGGGVNPDKGYGRIELKPITE